MSIGVIGKLNTSLEMRGAARSLSSRLLRSAGSGRKTTHSNYGHPCLGKPIENAVLIGPVLAQSSDRDPDLWLYRDRTVAVLRRYLRLSIEVGRMPSVLGREFFRARVTSYKASTFEDAVIFVHDVERSLEKLDGFDRQLIAKVVLQEYSKEEAARSLGCGYRTVERLFPEALDRMSEILLERKILTCLQS